MSMYYLGQKIIFTFLNFFLNMKILFYAKEESIKKIVNFFENSYDVNFNNIDLKTSNNNKNN